MFWNVPRGTLPLEAADAPDAPVSLFLRSQNDSNAAAIGLALRLSVLLPACVAALPADEPRESSLDWAPSTPGANCFVAASVVPPDRPTKISFRIFATCTALPFFKRKVRSVVPVVSDRSRRLTHCVVWVS